MASAVDIGMKRDDEFDIDTDDAVQPSPVQAAASRVAAMSVDGNASPDVGASPNGNAAPDTARSAQVGGEALAPATLSPAAVSPAAVLATDALPSALATEDAVIEVSDDEIEMAEPRAISPSPTLPSPATSSARSRPPAPPSVRPRSPSSSQRSWLPPPSHLSSAPPPVSPRPASADHWALANRTLELSRANARIERLVEQLAFRDARIAELEQALGRMQSKLDMLEARSMALESNAPWRSAGVQDAAPATPDRDVPVVTETRPVVGLEREVAAGEAASLDDDGEHDGDDADVERDSDFDTHSVASGSEEDLQQISGIGPRFEAALRKHGITRLSQIAAWSDADVRQVAKALRIPKSRIVKGRWVEVAREVIGTRAASE